MDFKQLMNLASQNKARAPKQETRDVASKNNKSNQSGVSDEAVKAFLAKKELEKKRKAAEEEAARRARIEERLTQSLGIKKKESANGTSRDKTASNEQKGTSHKIKSGEKQADKINMKHNDHRSTKQPQKITSKKFERDKTRPSLEAVNKTSELSSSSRKVHKKPGKDKKGPPMDFKALLAMAKRNKDGGGKLSTAMAQGSSKKYEEKSDVEEHVRKKEERVKKKEEHMKKSDRSSGQRKVLETKQASSSKPVSKGKTNGQMHSKGSLQFKGEGIPGKTQPSRQVQDSKRDLKHSELVNARRQTGIERKTLPSMAASTSHKKSVSSKTIGPNNDRMLMREGHVPKRRDRENLKRKRNPFEDEMDDFIDDGDGEEVDVSKYIKEIFGYDRTRFRDDDDDLAAMESSYSQIEREEFKSAKIARLEDEIEQLKELHELQKQRDKLKKNSKK